MKYKNPYYKRLKNTYLLEVSCGHCKTPMVVYEKAGKGNLIKMQIHRIKEAQVDLESHKGHLCCLNCGEELAKEGTYRNRLTYWVVRGKINTRQASSIPRQK